jgi:phage shock protein PspC (stress-responsive transcriptional regulator)
MESKTLYKTDQGSVVGGVCKGISEVYGFDVSVVRLIACLLLFAAGVPFIVYIIMWIVLPDKKDVVKKVDPKDDYTLDDDYYYD